MEYYEFDNRKFTKALEKRQLSPDSFARQIGVTKKSVLTWIKGTSIPYKKNLEKIFSKTDITEEEIAKDESKLGKTGQEEKERMQKEFETIFLPFFELYEINNTNYEAKKRLGALKRIDSDFFEGKNISLLNKDKGKFDKEFFKLNSEIQDIVNSMKKIISRIKETNPNQFLRMGNAADAHYRETALKIYQTNNSKLEDEQLYLSFSMNIVDTIDKIVAENSELKNWVESRTLPPAKEITDETLQRKISVIDNYLGVLVHFFFASEITKSNVVKEIVKAPQNYLWFILTYALTNDDDFMLEINNYLYKTDKNFDDEMAKKYSNFDRLSDDEFFEEYANRITNRLADMLQDKDIQDWFNADYSRENMTKEGITKVKYLTVQSVVHNDLLLRDRVMKIAIENQMKFSPNEEELDIFSQLGIDAKNYYKKYTDLLLFFSDLSTEEGMEKIYKLK